MDDGITVQIKNLIANREAAEMLILKASLALTDILVTEGNMYVLATRLLRLRDELRDYCRDNDINA